MFVRGLFHALILQVTALMGAHSLGGALAKNSGYKGQQTRDPLKFDNEYYNILNSHVDKYLPEV